MATCEQGGASISCTNGCGAFCGGGYCVYWCEPAVVQPPHWKGLDDSDSVTLCTTDVEPDSLRNVLQACIDTTLEWTEADEAKRPGDLHFSGALGELLNEAGLRRAKVSYA